MYMEYSAPWTQGPRDNCAKLLFNSAGNPNMRPKRLSFSKPQHVIKSHSGGGFHCCLSSKYSRFPSKQHQSCGLVYFLMNSTARCYPTLFRSLSVVAAVYEHPCKLESPELPRRPPRCARNRFLLQVEGMYWVCGGAGSVPGLSQVHVARSAQASRQTRKERAASPVTQVCEGEEKNRGGRPSRRGG